MFTWWAQVKPRVGEKLLDTWQRIGFVGKLFVSIGLACGIPLLFALAFGNLIVVKANASEIKFQTVTGFICNTPVQAEELAREGQGKGLDAVTAFNARIGEPACKVSRFGFVEHSTVGKVFVNNKVIEVERVVVIVMFNYFTGLWVRPPPLNRVQYLLLRVPGIAI